MLVWGSPECGPNPAPRHLAHDSCRIGSFGFFGAGHHEDVVRWDMQEAQSPQGLVFYGCPNCFEFASSMPQRGPDLPHERLHVRSMEVWFGKIIGDRDWGTFLSSSSPIGQCTAVLPKLLASFCQSGFEGQLSIEQRESTFWTWWAAFDAWAVAWVVTLKKFCPKLGVLEFCVACCDGRAEFQCQCALDWEPQWHLQPISWRFHVVVFF